MRQLEADPLWVVERDARQRDVARLRDELLLELSGLLRELAAVGVASSYVSDLATAPLNYERAVPILLDHLRRPYSDRARARIVRAFETKAARDLAWHPLLAVLDDGTLRGDAVEAAIAAISAMARPADLPCILELIARRSLGTPRAILVRNLARSRRPAARQALSDLSDDPDLRKEIAYRSVAARNA